jgi:uncharacterized protein (DUF433 family)
MSILEESVISKRQIVPQLTFRDAPSVTFNVATDIRQPVYISGWHGPMEVIHKMTVASATSFSGNTQILTVTVSTSETFVPGTNIPVYRISALLDGGMRVAQVMEDFPALTADDVIWARNYAQRYPNFGKQYPRKSFKRLLRSAGFYDAMNKKKEVKL